MPSRTSTMRPFWRASVLTILGCLSLSQVVFAQGASERPPPTIGGTIQLRPVTPVTPSRPAEGQDAGERWNVARQGNDATPVAAFVESFKGSDAAINVYVGQARLLTAKKPIAAKKGTAVVATADPTVLDFEVLPDPRMIRVTGKRAGVTDLTIITEDGETHIFEVHVTYDVALLQAQLQQVFPEALIKLRQIREHLVLEGQARSAVQAGQIEQTLRICLSSLQISRTEKENQAAGPNPDDPRRPAPREPNADPNGAGGEGPASEGEQPTEIPQANPEYGKRPTTSVEFPAPQVINLLTVPGLQQVLLQVRVAELNRTGLRQIGADIFVQNKAGAIVGTQLGGAGVRLNKDDGSLLGLAVGDTTAFGIFPSPRVEITLRALRENGLATILAEPNLTALNGEKASFLAGGQFPVPVPQSGGTTGAASYTVEWKDFGVQLEFTPIILDEGKVRLKVTPEVSSIDQGLAVTVFPGADAVPGITTRKVDTTVELREGQTLVLAGLLQVTLDAGTARIPGLGDLPYIGPMFSNTLHERVEKELLVLVTPYLVAPLDPDQVPCLPGSELQDPNDLEFYLLNRIEGRRGREFRTTTAWDDPWGLVPLLHLERDHACGPLGFSE